MGYELTRFIGNIDEELLCSICALVLKNPVQSRCEHSYCNNCIQGWLLMSSVCPVDGQPLTINDLHLPSRLLRNLLSKLTIRCHCYEIGCLEIIRLENLDNHCARCTFNPDAEVTCDKGCKLLMSRREYNKSDCLAHYANQIKCQQDEILKLKNEIQFHCGEKENTENKISQLKTTIAKLNNEVVQQKNCIRKLNNVVDNPFKLFKSAFK